MLSLVLGRFRLNSGRADERSANAPGHRRAGVRLMRHIHRMRRLPPERLLTVGSCVAGLGGAGSVAYFIYSISGEGRDFFRAPGIVGLAILLFGITILVRGLLAPSPIAARNQTQISGNSSTNLQAGGNITTGVRLDPESSGEKTD